MSAPTLATHWMIVANSTLNEAVSHDSYHPIWKKFVANLLNFRQALSCTVCKGILDEAYSPIPSSFEQDCQHHACKACLGKKKTLKPPCIWCRDYNKYVRCTLIDNHVRSYENMCEYLRQSRQYAVIKNEAIVDATSSISLPEALQDSRGLCVEKLVNEIMMLCGSAGSCLVIRDRTLNQARDEPCELSDENSDSRSDEFDDVEQKLRLFSPSDFGSPSGGSGSDGKSDDFGFGDFHSFSCSLDDDDAFITMDRTDKFYHDDMPDCPADLPSNSAFDFLDIPSVGSAPIHAFKIKDAPLSSSRASSSAPTSLFDTLVDRQSAIVVKKEPEEEQNGTACAASSSTSSSSTTTTIRGFDFGGNVAAKLGPVKTEGKISVKSSISKSYSAANLAGFTPIANVTLGAATSTTELVTKTTASSGGSSPSSSGTRAQVFNRPTHTMLLAFKTPAPVEAKSSQNGSASSNGIPGSSASSRRPHASKAPKNRKGCRCGTATNNPGTLTCCGQRCPCYVEAKECIDCKCRGCRNPYRSGGRKIRPHIVPTENIQVHFPPSPKPYSKPGAAAAHTAASTASITATATTNTSISIGSINVGQITASPGIPSPTASNTRPTLQYLAGLIEQGHNANISVNVSVSTAPKIGITAKLNTDPVVGVPAAQISVVNDDLMKLLH